MRARQQAFRRVVAGIIGVAAAALVAASPALAAVSFDPATGTGHVDKADVEAAFGWREATFQANARKLSFHLESSASWTWDCTIDGQVVTIVSDQQASRAVGDVATGTGRHGGVSGFDLTGFAAASGAPTNPASCPSGSPANVHSASTETLFADLRSQARAIWSN
jgi:hypothetical protein